MSNRRITFAASCLLTVLLAVSTVHSQQIVQQGPQKLEQYDPNTAPQHTAHTGEHISGRRYKRMYAMCPPGFFRIGNECYYISRDGLNFLDAHFECKVRNSKLAEPLKFDDRSLRRYLLRSNEKNYLWIGGTYNWLTNKWQWGYSGKEIGYQSFSQMVPGSSQDLSNHCAVLNPDLKFRWSAKLCTEKLNFICQHKMPLVSSRSRAKVYTRWNETFPNELANEVEVVVADQPRSKTLKDYYRTNGNSKLNLTKVSRNWKKLNQAKRIKNYPIRKRPLRNEYISNDIVHRPVVEYTSDNSYNNINGNGNGNGYRNGNNVFSRPFNVDIRNRKNHHMNEVIGEFRHHHNHPATKAPSTTTTVTTTSTTTSTTTTPVPETVPTEALRVVTDKQQSSRLSKEERRARHKLIRERLNNLSSDERAQFEAKRAMVTKKYQHTKNNQLLSHDEKKARLLKYKERLQKLTPEERDRFFLERAKRKQSKKVHSQNETIP